jgi:hypothetical protein
MKLVFCTTCKGRAGHISDTLPKNLKDNPKAHFVLVDYGDSGDLLKYVRKAHMPDIASGQLSVYSLQNVDRFRMAHAKNVAHRLGIIEGGDLLCNLDADNLTGPGFEDFIGVKFEEQEKLFLWANRNQPAEVRYPKGCNGRIVVSRNTFLITGGYDELKYADWGPDDKDFHFRLRRLGGIACEIPRRFLNVILHNDKMRFRDMPEVGKRMMQWGQDPSADEHFQEVDSTATIANFGAVGLGVVFKNMDWDSPISIPPLPTRVFGIGMHKTATTSLHKALAHLGFDSAHWKSAHWAKAIWEEMQTWGRSLTLEKHYALCDLPFPMLFKALDVAYPGSKFILTLRNEEGWIDTVEKHWSHEFNPFRGAWDTDPFTHRCHTLLYGRRKFDRAIFLDRYRRHNAEVLQHFKDRPGDLLVMHMDNGAGWRELCGFLGRPVPLDKKYPRAFAEY